MSEDLSQLMDNIIGDNEFIEDESKDNALEQGNYVQKSVNDIMEKALHEAVKKLYPQLLDDKVDEYITQLEELYSTNFDGVPVPYVLKLYQVDGSEEVYHLNYHQYNFIKNLEVLVNGNTELSFAEIMGFLQKIIDSDISNYHGVLKTIFESCCDIEVDKVISFIKDMVDGSNGSKLNSFLGSNIFKIVLALDTNCLLEEVGKEFTKIVDPYSLNISSIENNEALEKISVLCKEGNVKEMEKFDLSHLDPDSAGVLHNLLNYCSNQYGDSSDLLG